MMRKRTRASSIGATIKKNSDFGDEKQQRGKKDKPTKNKTAKQEAVRGRQIEPTVPPGGAPSIPHEGTPEAYNIKGYEISEDERRVIFESPLAKQGLHPAYLLGLKPLPWQQHEQAMASQMLQQKLQERQMEMEKFHTFGWPGQQIAVNPHMINKTEPPRWPFIPERTVPGYIFEGAEFYKGYSTLSRPVTKIETASRTTTLSGFLTEAFQRPIQYLITSCGWNKKAGAGEEPPQHKDQQDEQSAIGPTDEAAEVCVDNTPDE